MNRQPIARMAMVPGWVVARLLDWPEGLRAYVVLQSCDTVVIARLILGVTDIAMEVITRDLIEREALAVQPDGALWFPMDHPRCRG